MLRWVWGLICIADVGVDLCCGGFGGSFVLPAWVVVDLLLPAWVWLRLWEKNEKKKKIVL